MTIGSTAFTMPGEPWRMRAGFGLNPIEANIIHRHMFPLNPTPPKYKESVVVTCADKICATREVWDCVRTSPARKFRRLLSRK